jgi:tetratricopeptide (TPR) repeat protein
MALLLSITASASDIPGYPEWQTPDPREIALLPQYCKYSQVIRERVPDGGNKTAIAKWTELMGPRRDSPGPLFEAMHHYCWGLLKTNRAVLLARSEDVKKFYLNSSITEFDYVLERAPDSFVLLPEILTKKGENLIRLGKAAPGILELQHAIDLKPDYWPPYAVMSDYYKKIGDFAKARELLNRALEFAPDAKPLQRRVSELQKANAQSKK